MTQPFHDFNQNKILNWLPRSWIPYAMLARVDRPAGTWLLFLPCLWGLGLSGGQVFNSNAPLLSLALYLKYAVFFALGAFLARSAGCTWNDILDQDFDKQVERTQQRPLANKTLSEKQAYLFLAAQLFVAFIILLQFPLRTIIITVFGAVPAAIYPLMKRFTYWPQAWLGLTFNWGILAGYSIFQDHISWSVLCLYGAGILWTLGYDTIYALQDIKDDLLVGVKSTAIRFGQYCKVWVLGFYLGVLVCLIIVGMYLNNLLYWPCLVLAFFYVVPKLVTLDIENRQQCLSFFKLNRNFGLLIALALLLGQFQ